MMASVVNLNAMIRLSEHLLNPSMAKMPLEEWLTHYNSAKDDHLKYLLMKCIPFIESIDLPIILNQVQPTSLAEKCDLLYHLLTHHDPPKESIVFWLCSQPELLNTNLNQNLNSCVCSLIKLCSCLTEKGSKLPVNLVTKVLDALDNQRCALNSYLDFVSTLVETNTCNPDYLEELYSELIPKLNPSDYLCLNGTIDDGPEVIFNEISDCLLLRKLVLPQLLILSNLGLHKFTAESINKQLKSLQELVSNSIHWSYHPFIDLYLEDDSMMLRCLHSLVQLQGSTAESAVHSTIKLFLDSINHDVTVLVEWLSSDSEIAGLTLRLLLSYLKLPNIKSQCSALVKLFFRQLMERVDGLWRKQLFPYNPSALLKYEDKFLQ